jgi:hypothetical protein
MKLTQVGLTMMTLAKVQMSSTERTIYTNCSRWDTHDIATRGRNSHVNHMWAWNESGPKLFAPIAFNKNGQESNKKFDAMIGAIKA